MRKLTYFVIAALLISLLAVWGCERDIPVTSSFRDQILLFIDNSDDGRELFSTDIYANVPFTIDDSGDRYFYEIDSIRRNIDIAFDTAAYVEPYENVPRAVAWVTDNLLGALKKIDSQDNITHCANMVSTIRRYALFIRLYGEYYQYNGWRFWGYANQVAGNFNRKLTGPSGTGYATITFYGDNNPNIPESYSLYDTLPVFKDGFNMVYSSDKEENILVRTSEGEIERFSTEWDVSSYKTEWITDQQNVPFNKTMLVEAHWVFEVDTIDFDIPIVESTLVKFDDYVVFYKSH